MHGMPFNRIIPGTGAQIFGPFLMAGDASEFRSLTPLELEATLDAMAPALSQDEFGFSKTDHTKWIRALSI